MQPPTWPSPVSIRWVDVIPPPLRPSSFKCGSHTWGGGYEGEKASPLLSRWFRSSRFHEWGQATRSPAQDMFSFWAFPIGRARSQLVFGLEGSMMVRTLREPHLACIQVVLHKEHALLTSLWTGPACARIFRWGPPQAFFPANLIHIIHPPQARPIM